MTDLQLWDLYSGFSFIFFGAVLAFAALSLLRLNNGCTNERARFYEIAGRLSLGFGRIVVVFGAALSGNAVIGVV